MSDHLQVRGIGIIFPFPYNPSTDGSKLTPSVRFDFKVQGVKYWQGIIYDTPLYLKGGFKNDTPNKKKLTQCAIHGQARVRNYGATDN